jgi:hypothetical protein
MAIPVIFHRHLRRKQQSLQVRARPGLLKGTADIQSSPLSLRLDAHRLRHVQMPIRSTAHVQSAPNRKQQVGPFAPLPSLR